MPSACWFEPSVAFIVQISLCPLRSVVKAIFEASLAHVSSESAIGGEGTPVMTSAITLRSRITVDDVAWDPNGDRACDITAR
jgi:hypothetical protein